MLSWLEQSSQVILVGKNKQPEATAVKTHFPFGLWMREVQWEMKPYISSYIYEQSLNQETLQCHIKDQVRSFQLHSDKQLQPYFLLFVVVSLKKINQKTLSSLSVLSVQNEKRCKMCQFTKWTKNPDQTNWRFSGLSNQCNTFIFFEWNYTGYSMCWNKKTGCIQAWTRTKQYNWKNKTMYSEKRSYFHTLWKSLNFSIQYRKIVA